MSPAILASPPSLIPSTIAFPVSTVDIARVRILLPVAPRWSLGLLHPTVVHLQETEDGEPRRANVDGRVVRVAPAPCHAFLVDQGFPLHGIETDVCPTCNSIAELVHGAGLDGVSGAKR